MLSAALLVKALGRKPLIGRALAASILMGVLFDAMVAYDISFLLSLAATAGLLTLGKRWNEYLGSAGSRVVQFLQTAALATLSSMVPCIPLLALLSPDLSWASIGANVIAAPLGEAVALPLCLLHGIAEFFRPLELGIARVASGALIVIDQIAHASAEVKWMRTSVPLPSAWQLALLVAGGTGAFVLLARAKYRPALCFACAAVMVLGGLEWAQRLYGTPHDLLRITAVDVGQGDSTLIDLPRGQLMLIDGGGIVGSTIDPGRRVLEPLLRARRRERIDVMVLSHPHPDHFLGLLRIAQRFKVTELWDTGQGEAKGAGPQYAQLLASLRQQGTRIRRPNELCGSRLVSGATIQVLAPCPHFTEGRGANDNSFVLRISYGALSALLVGDAEHAEEQELLERGGNLEARFLKVGHHGSRTSSSPEFLAAVAPKYASISCGVRNSFGHPHAVTLDHLHAQGAQILRLDRTGSVQWQTDGVDEALQASSLRENPLWRAATSLLSAGG
jgi:competence protein ComEC